VQLIGATAAETCDNPHVALLALLRATPPTTARTATSRRARATPERGNPGIVEHGGNGVGEAFH